MVDLVATEEEEADPVTGTARLQLHGHRCRGEASKLQGCGCCSEL